MQDENFFSDIAEWVKNRFRNTKQRQNNYFDSRIGISVNRGAVWIDTSVPYDLYNTIPQLKTPVDKLAAMFANGVFKYQKIGSTDLKELPTEYQKLLENPNITQGQNPFLKQYLTQLIVYGNQFIYKNTPSPLTKVPTSLIHMSASVIKPILTGKFIDQISMDGIVEKYEYTENNTVKPFEVNQILWSKIGDLDSHIEGYSPLKAMKYPLSNTVGAYKYLNVISTEKGNIGILSTAPSKDAMGALPTTPEQKKELEAIHRDENGIEDYQKKIHITTASVTWQPMTYPTKDLLLMEQIDANFLTILNILGVNQNLFVNSTYENLRHGLVQTHNDTVIPYADGFTQALSKFIGIPEGFRLVLDYSHLPYLQPDKVSEATTFNTVSSGLSSLTSSGIITVQQANAILENQFGIKMK